MTETAWNRLAKDYIDRVGADKVRHINDTTRDMIRRVIKDGIDAGSGSDEIARALRAKWQDLSKWRSGAIARTEVIAASNYASQETARLRGDVEKEWLATSGSRTRADHAAASGQRVGLDEPFVVGGSRLMFPGDSSLGAAAEQVIQCRCTEVYYGEEDRA